MVYKVVKNAHVVVHTVEPPSDAEWQLYFEHLGRHLPAIEAIVVMTAGGGPDGKQRDYADRFWLNKQHKPNIAVITPSPFIRAVTGALGWLIGDRIKTFAERDFEGAFSYVRLRAEQRAAVEAALKELGQALRTRD
jgi:ferredoxin-NADP reductase